MTDHVADPLADQPGMLQQAPAAADWLAFTTATLRELVAGHAPRTLAERLCRLAERHAPGRVASIMSLGDDKRLHLFAAPGIPAALAAEIDGLRPGAHAGSCGNAVLREQAVLVDDIASDTRWEDLREPAQRWQLHSCHSYPVWHEGELIGTFALTAAGGPATPAPLELLEFAATLSGTLLGYERLHQRRDRQQALHAAMLDNALLGIGLLHGGSIRAANATLAHMLGYPDAQALVGCELPRQHLEPQDLGLWTAQLERPLRETGHARAQLRVRRADGELAWWEIGARRIEQPGADFDSVWSALDITQRRQVQDQLRWQARHDALTQLPNRFGLEHFLKYELEQAARDGTCLALGYLDLDDFARVNERWGHLVGDAVLRQVAQRLRGALSPGDLVARIGGDEFVLVLNRLRGAEQLADRLRPFEQAMRAAFSASPTGLCLDMSLGLAVFPDDEATADALLRQADAALLSCKMHKATRSSWWLRWGEPVRGDMSTSTPARAPAPYGEAAAQLLGQACAQAPLLDAALLDGYFARLREDPATADALDALDAHGRQALRELDAAQLRELLEPGATAAQRADAALGAGSRQALSGVAAAALTRGFFGLHHELAERVGQLSMHSLRRLHLLDVLAQRLSGELQQRLLGAEQVTHAYHGWATQALGELERIGVWADFVEQAGAALARLPGIVGVMLARAGEDGRFVFEYRSDELHQLADAGASIGDQGSLASCWVHARVQCGGAYLPHAAAAVSAGVRSHAAIPVLDAHERPVAVVAMFGRHAGQFGAHALGPWLHSVQQVFRQAWARLEGAARAAPLSSAAMAHARGLIGERQVQMLYQPIIDLRSGECLHVEALARLRDGDRLRTPDEFLPACGSVELGQLFAQGLEQVLHQLGAWERQGARVDASINLPPSVLRQRDLCRQVEQALQRHGIEPRRLTFELLETEQWIGDSTIDATLARLKQLGTRMAMDDLGAGHSTLLRLRQLRFDVVKIDRGLVRDMPSNPQEVAAIVGGLTGLMHRLGLFVVVEGLETPELLRLAAELGADAGQGYAIAHPMDAGRTLHWLQARQLEAIPAI